MIADSRASPTVEAVFREAAGPAAGAGAQGRQRFTEVLAALAAQPSDRIAVRDILAAFGNRAFGALMLFFAAPNALPMPPGVSAVLGAPLIFITAQLMLGRQTLWLPGFVCGRSLPRSTLATVAAKLNPLLARVERALACRLTGLLGGIPERLIGFACLGRAAVLFLPIPFGNMLPGFALSAFALGIIQRDGVAVIVGWVLTIASLAVVAAFSGAIIAGVLALVR